jgi:heparin binding hemagglutinin HbhA
MSEPTEPSPTKAADKTGMSMNDAMRQIWAPFYAMVGAGDMAAEAVREYLNKARAKGKEAAEATADTTTGTGTGTTVYDTQHKLTQLQERLLELRSQFFTKVGQMPTDVAGWRAKLDPSDMRQAMENYAQALQELYTSLTSRGEQAIEKFRQQTREQVGAAGETAEERLSRFVADARELTDEVLGRMGRRTRSAGDTSADVAYETAAAGEEVASTARGATSKARAASEASRSTTRRRTPRTTGDTPSSPA